MDTQRTLMENNVAQMRRTMIAYHFQRMAISTFLPIVHKEKPHRI